MSLNKKVLAAAIVGALMIGGNAAAQQATTLPVDHLYYAQEIVIGEDGFEPVAAPDLTWASGYNYSLNEVKYVRVQLHGATFTDALVNPSVEGGSVGALNGLGTDVITFSVTSNGPTAGETGEPGITADSDFSLPLAGAINIPTKGTISVTVSVYDQSSQAQAGGPTGRLAIGSGSYSQTPFLSFAPSYTVVSNEANILTAEVSSASNAAADEDTVAYGFFAPDISTNPVTDIDEGTLNDNLGIVFLDPDGDGGQGRTLGIDGAELDYDLFADTSEWIVEGDFSAAIEATLGGADTTELEDDRAVWVGAPTEAAEPLVYQVDGTTAIPAGTFSFTFNPEAADEVADDYDLVPLTVDLAGTIRRNGTELQAPLAQVPPAWISRLVLTNTGNGSPAYSIRVMSESGNAVTTAANTLTGVVAPGTNVIDLKSVMTGFVDMTRQRGTIVVTVEAPDAVGAGAIQGLYQIVNPGSGSISNHVMVRPGTN